MQLSFASIHLCLLLIAGAVHAAPTPLITRETTIMSRQEAAALTEPTTVQTSNTADTMMGPVTESCVVKLTPIKDDAGKDAVRVEKTCTLQMDGANGGNQGGNNGNNGGGDAKSSTSSASSAATSSSSSSSGAAASSTASGASATSVASSSSSAASGSASNTASGAASTGASSASGVASSGSVAASSVTSSATGSAASSAFSQAPLTIKPSGFASGSVIKDSAAASETASGSGSASAGGSTATSAADVAATNAAGTNPTTNFALPGTKVSVLPIGLGVFAGISVIALIVVGLVTYERTKYRKAFRQRKLAESGGAMGYGGMAQRQ